MPLTRKNTAVLVLGTNSSADFENELTRAGFGTVVSTGSRTVRQAMTDVLNDGASAVVTVNPEEGFTCADVENVFERLTQSPDCLSVGEPREPAKPNTPEKLYSFLSGVNAATAQTSLFAMSADTARIMTNMKSTEENFVSNMPLEARINGIDLIDVPTEVSVSAPDYGLLTRSFKLYYVFIKFSIAAMIAYIVDIGTFGLFEVVFGYLSDEYKILVATILSRILCSIATYILNRMAVFKSKVQQQSSVVRFVILSVVQLLASWLLVWGLGVLLNANDFGNMLLKIIVDLVIFIASFTIMRDWVFKKPEASSN